MKISEFAQKNDITIDAVRHYMDLKLLLPLKNGGQYDFDNQCQADLEEIVALKAMRFPLKTIKKILDFKRLSNLPSAQYQDHLHACYAEQLAWLKSEELQIKGTITGLEKLLNDSQSTTKAKSQLGIHLNLLPYLCCPSCGNERLKLETDHLVDNMIFNGTLHCQCGSHLAIENGILKSGPYIESGYDVSFMLSDYIKDTDTQLITNIRKSANWFDSKLTADVFDSKVVLELGSGNGFFIRGAIKRIERAHLYIAIDHDLSRHLYLKEMLESAGSQLPIQMICCDFKAMPLKNTCADVLVDASGTSNYGFEHTQFLLDDIAPMIKENTKLIGSYIIFEKYAFTNPLSLDQRRFFEKDRILDNLNHHGFEILDIGQGGSFNQESKYEDYFTKKDLVTNIWLYAQKRWG
ncbi:MAG: MerR family transcriptional regulator [Clostridia bacterium]|nr:MerR family transcriptional regulator [Clostridia bacterium]